MGVSGEKFSLEDIGKNRRQQEPAYEVVRLTREEYCDLNEMEGGYKFAYLFKDKKENNQQNAYSLFVADNCAKEGRKILPKDYERFDTKWRALTSEKKQVYKDKVKSESRSKPSEIPWQLAERRASEKFRRDYGVNAMGDDQLCRLYYPPASSTVRPLRGREHLLDLETLMNLYIIEEHDDVKREAKMLTDVTKYFPTKQDFLRKPIVLIGIVPASQHPDPNCTISRPLEIYMTVFTVSEGLSDVAYHVFVDLGSAMKENPHEKWDGRGYLPYQDCVKDAMRVAWNQAFFKHNIPIVDEGFATENRSGSARSFELESHYNGWDEHARKVLPLNKNYQEIYSTVVEMAREYGKDKDGLLIFTKLEEVEMVERCFKWLHDEAAKKVGLENVPNDLVEVSSLEHLAWHAASLSGLTVNEVLIEKAFSPNDLADDCDLKCGFHSTKPSSFICARGAALTNVFNILNFFLPVFGFTERAKNHYPNGDPDIRMPPLRAAGSSETEKDKLKSSRVKSRG